MGKKNNNNNNKKTRNICLQYCVKFYMWNAIDSGLKYDKESNHKLKADIYNRCAPKITVEWRLQFVWTCQRKTYSNWWNQILMDLSVEFELHENTSILYLTSHLLAPWQPWQGMTEPAKTKLTITYYISQQQFIVGPVVCSQ